MFPTGKHCVPPCGGANTDHGCNHPYVSSTNLSSVRGTRWRGAPSCRRRLAAYCLSLGGHFAGACPISPAGVRFDSGRRGRLRMLGRPDGWVWPASAVLRGGRGRRLLLHGAQPPEVSRPAAVRAQKARKDLPHFRPGGVNHAGPPLRDGYFVLEVAGDRAQWPRRQAPLRIGELRRPFVCELSFGVDSRRGFAIRAGPDRHRDGAQRVPGRSHLRFHQESLGVGKLDLGQALFAPYGKNRPRAWRQLRDGNRRPLRPRLRGRRSEHQARQPHRLRVVPSRRPVAPRGDRAIRAIGAGHGRYLPAGGGAARLGEPG